MKDWIDGLTDLASTRGDQAVLERGLADYTDSFGFSGYAYVHIQPSHTVTISNYSPEWRSKYSEQHLIAIDPVVKRAKSLKRAFTWSGEERQNLLTEKERTFYAMAARYGIRSGVTVPIKAAHGSISIFTLASETPVLHLREDIDAVAAAAAVGQLHARIWRMPTANAERYPSWLDPKEAAYLNWISVGKTMEEAADLEGVKYNSVKSKLEEARKRLNVHTMPHLVSVVIRAKLI